MIISFALSSIELCRGIRSRELARIDWICRLRIGAAGLKLKFSGFFIILFIIRVNEKGFEEIPKPFFIWWRCRELNPGHYGYELSRNPSCFLNKSKIYNVVKDIFGRSEMRRCDLLRLFLFILTQEELIRK